MHPTETQYLLARSSKDYKLLHDLVESETGKPDTTAYSYPTVFAIRNGEIIGFFATHQNDRAVIAGPLVIKGGRNPFVAMRLAESYDTVMRMNGIKFYYCSVDAKRTDVFGKGRIESLGLTYWETVDGIAWYKRHLQVIPTLQAA